MKKVICDTNIWYNIAKGDIPVKSFLGYQLIATGINVLELSSTKNLLHDFDLVKGAIKAMYNHHYQVIEFDVWDYILCYHTSIRYTAFNREIFQSNLELFRGIIVNEFDANFKDKDRLEGLNQRIDTYNQPAEKLAKYLNEGLITTRKKGLDKHGLKSMFKKKIRNNETSYNEIRELILESLALRADVQATQLLGKVDWYNIELFFRTWDLLYKEKILHGNSKFEANDINDLFNMAYVGKDDLYWTKEKSWIRLMKSNPITAKYVFEPNL